MSDPRSYRYNNVRGPVGPNQRERPVVIRANHGWYSCCNLNGLSDVSPLRPGTFWHTSGLRRGESVELLESIAIEICKLQTLKGD